MAASVQMNYCVRVYGALTLHLPNSSRSMDSSNRGDYVVLIQLLELYEKTTQKQAIYPKGLTYDSGVFNMVVLPANNHPLLPKPLCLYCYIFSCWTLQQSANTSACRDFVFTETL